MQGAAPDYEVIWKQFVLQGVMQEDILPPSLTQSWRRCAALGLNPYGTATSSADTLGIYKDQVEHGREIEPQLLALVRPALEDLHQFAEGSQCVVLFADTQACVADLVGDQTMQREFEDVGLHVGALWSEMQQGANALALALHESFPIQLTGAMHYRTLLHPLYTSAAPIHDLFGQTIGVLGVVGRRASGHAHTLAMITAAAQAISNRLQMQAWLSNANDLLSELQTILQSLAEGILLLRDDGIISQMNAPAGTMLGLMPARVTGRRLRDVLPLPNVLTQALALRQSLSYEELVFDTAHGRIPFLCTLKPIFGHLPEATGLQSLMNSSGLLLTDPVTADGFVMVLRSIERVQKLVHRMTGAQARLTFANVIGESPVLKEAVRLARLAAGSISTVLLHGETGTGKEIFAQSIHNSSARSDGPFVAVNCAAIPRELITTELFGYEGGSFTGADRQGRPGKFEQAHGGTLFLDEIGDMPLDLQTSLLRALETRTVVRVGGQRVISVDVRIITATHKDHRQEALRSNFRSDLYYRLNVLTIEIPALRERSEDIPLLVQHFLQRQSRISGHSHSLTSDALLALCQYSWPGNVRELENMLERVTYLVAKTTISVEDIPLVASLLRSPSSENVSPTAIGIHPAPSEKDRHTLSIESTEDAGFSLKDRNSNAEVQAILHAWRTCKGNMTRAAALLGISRTTLWRKMAKYKLASSVLENG